MIFRLNGYSSSSDVPSPLPRDHRAVSTATVQELEGGTEDDPLDVDATMAAMLGSYTNARRQGGDSSHREDVDGQATEEEEQEEQEKQEQEQEEEEQEHEEQEHEEQEEENERNDGEVDEDDMYENRGDN